MCVCVCVRRWGTGPGLLGHLGGPQPRAVTCSAGSLRGSRRDLGKGDCRCACPERPQLSVGGAFARECAVVCAVTPASPPQFFRSVETFRLFGLHSVPG